MVYVAGGWIRVSSIDMTYDNNMCLFGLNTIYKGSKTLCAMDIYDAGCSSTVFAEGVW